jgi:hypothetical protein
MTARERSCDDHGRPGELRHGDLEPSRRAGLLGRVAPVEGNRRTRLWALTERGRERLEHHSSPDHGPTQRFYVSRSKARELPTTTGEAGTCVGALAAMAAAGTSVRSRPRLRGDNELCRAHRARAPPMTWDERVDAVAGRA